MERPAHNRRLNVSFVHDGIALPNDADRTEFVSAVLFRGMDHSNRRVAVQSGAARGKEISIRLHWTRRSHDPTKDERRLMIAQRVFAMAGLLTIALCGFLLFRLATN